MTTEIKIREATKADLGAIARLHRKARQAAMPQLPSIHAPEEDLWFFENIVFAQETLLVASENTVVLGFIAYKDDWVNHLYIDPDHWRKDIGSQLLARGKAKAKRLQLWTFQENQLAQAFYKAQGFVELKRTDGHSNEEKRPDILMVWET